MSRNLTDSQPEQLVALSATGKIWRARGTPLKPLRTGALRSALAVMLMLATTVTAGGLEKLRAWTGGATPPLSLTGLDGKQHALTDYRGKVVVINFWATWCGPCVKEMPSLQNLARSFKGEGFALITINFGEDKKRIESFLKKNDLKLEVWIDSDMSASKDWVKKGLPTTYVIDSEQRIRYQVLGDLEWDSAEVKALMRDLLPKR